MQLPQEIVADTSGILAFATIGRVDLLEKMFRSILLPPAVLSELGEKSERWPILKQMLSCPGPFEAGFLPEVSLGMRNELLFELGDGESDAIALAFSSGLSLHIDDREARARAEDLNVTCFGSLKILTAAKFTGAIPSGREIGDQMLTEGRFFSVDVYRKFLRTLGE